MRSKSLTAKQAAKKLASIALRQLSSMPESEQEERITDAERRVFATPVAARKSSSNYGKRPFLAVAQARKASARKARYSHSSKPSVASFPDVFFF